MFSLLFNSLLAYNSSLHFPDPPLQVYKNAIGDLQKKLQADNPESIWVLMDGWSAVTTSYLGLEICTPNILFILVEPL